MYLKQVEHQLRAPVAARGHVLDARAVERGEGGLRRGEVGGQGHQDAVEDPSRPSEGGAAWFFLESAGLGQGGAPLSLA